MVSYKTSNSYENHFEDPDILTFEHCVRNNVMQHVILVLSLNIISTYLTSMLIGYSIIGQTVFSMITVTSIKLS